MENPGKAGNPARHAYIAIDIGASSGRVILGQLAAGRVELEVLHRFPNAVVPQGGSLHWDIGFLHAQMLTGLGLAAARARDLGVEIASIGIDTWAVDYGLLRDGELLGDPFAYRDPRTENVIESVHRLVSREQLYRINGLQFLPFNTIYQLACEPELRGLRALLVPDLLAYLLTGAMRTEETNASTTGLLDAATGRFSGQLAAALGLDPGLFGELIAPGQVYGQLLPGIAAGTGLGPGTPVVAVGSHDTASAVLAVPAEPGTDFAYISSGTWSLVGLELDAPVLGDAAREANFTNERGVDSTIRFLRNVGGLWLLQESLRQWQLGADSLPGLLKAATAWEDNGARIDADSQEFLAPGSMADRIRAAAGRRGPDGAWVHLDPGAEPAAVVRCILESLAQAYARALRTATELTGCVPERIHVVGGGSQNSLLCQLTANATGLPVFAGPVEATALGNVLVQARAAGEVPGTLGDLRAVVARSMPVTEYLPAAPARHRGAGDA
ncbi:rhamnulokinase family protein [Paeniglutamicibacter psychrophenolicus]|uniref:Rhamnulokinase n=1 Tax=Paeniglutamicibacter psychrophenolicus TaxID=257454 RepID=A0ABS4W936_9MICC|nr:rhamnulokinase family protein [Paeniglutamicibacter psychrophenolicus]MBP2372703.1 rhamnulokinase [Paeniglutamicibacter psychrophenolicus]